jgi:hypothetical protein
LVEQLICNQQVIGSNPIAGLPRAFREVEPSGKVIQWQGPIFLVVESGEWRIETLSKLRSQR